MDDQSMVYGTAQALTSNGFEKVYAIGYNADGGTTASTSTENTTVNYTFDGWATSNTGTEAYTNGQNVNNLTSTAGGTVNLYALWTTTRAYVVLPNATKKDKVLEGWYNGDVNVPANKVGVPGGHYTPTASVTLKAKWIDQYDFTMSANVTSMHVGDTPSSAFTFTYENGATFSIDPDTVFSYNKSTNTLTALKEGTATITFHQANTTTVKEGDKPFVITVSKVDNTLSVSPSYTCYVDTANFANIISNKNSDATVTTTSTAASIAYYNVSENKIYVPNSEAKSFTDTTVTIHIKQAATGKYKAVDKAITLTVKKRPNALYANGSDNYSVDMYVDRTQNVTLTAMNTDYTNCPISVSPVVVGDSLYATYAYNQASHSGTVTSRHYINKTIKWRFTQPENYKYLAGCDTFEVVVKKADETRDCENLLLYHYDGEELNCSGFGDDRAKWTNNDNLALKLIFKGRHQSASVNYSITPYQKVNGSWQPLSAVGSSLTTSHQDFYRDLDPKATAVKFEGGGTLNKYVCDVRITRKGYLNIGTDPENGFATVNKTLTISKKDGVSAIYPGDKGQQATTVYWGIANGGNLKIKCDDSRFTFSQNTITGVDCNSGTTEITVFFTDTVAGIVTATATVYNDVYNQTFTVKGIIEKSKQPVTWNYDVVRYNDTISNAVSATVSPVTYESADPNIIKVIKDDLDQNTILVAVDTGTVDITAHVPGTAYYAAIDTVHAIKVTMKQLQTIVWNQSLFDLELGGDNRTLTATATSDVEGCISTRLVEYVSSNPDVVYVAPGTNVLQIKGVGTTTVTAFQRGGWDIDGHEYDSVAVQKTAIVRDPNAPCDNFVYQQPSEYTFGNMGNLVSTETKSSTEIDFGGRVAGESSIYFKGIKRGITQYYGGTMSVEQYLPAASPHWQTVKSIGTPSTDGYDSVHFVFSREATKMRVTVTNAKGEHVFRDCQIKQARFIETTTPAKFNINVGASEDQTIYLSYSNVVGNISFTLGQENSSFSVNRTLITDTCGGHAKNVAVVITYNPQHEVQNEQDVLTISDGTTSCEVILKGSATRVGRTITWNHADVRSIYTVEKDTLIAEARTSLNASAGTVEFTYVNNTSTANGSIDANNILSFTSAGTAYVVANTPDHDYYFPAATVGPKRWDVSLTPTEVVTAPTIGSVVSGTALSDITVSGGTARNTINQGSVSGTFTVQNGNVTDVGPNKPVTVKFTPEDGTMYDVCTYNMYIEVTQRPATDEEIGTVTAGHITFGEKLSDAVLSMSGTLNGHGTLVMTDPQKDDVKDVDTYENLKVLFTPDNTNIAPKELTVSVTVDKAEPAVTPQAADITYGQPVSASNLTTASGDVAGSWAWAVDDTQVLSVGDHVLKANFTSDSANYNNLSNVGVTLTVNKIETLEVEVPLSFCAGESETFHGETYTTAGTDQINAVGATRDTVYNVTVTVLQPTTGTDSKTITVGDNESWNGIDLSGYAVGSHEVEYHTTNVAGCDSTVTLSLTVNAVVPVGPNTFTNYAGDNDWQNAENWTNGVPSGVNPDVIISGELIIDESVTVGGLTILPTGGVTVITHGTLTVNGTTADQSGYGDLYVKNDGAVILGNSANLQVRDFKLDAKLGDGDTKAASGQVKGDDKLNVNGDAYFQLSFDPAGAISYGWYDFTVPFPVNISGGIERINSTSDKVMVCGQDFLLMEDDEVSFVNGGKGWRQISSGVLEPGKLYTITFDDEVNQNTFRFAWNGQGSITNGDTFAAQCLTGSDASRNGWNALGNAMLQHGYVDGSYKLQAYDHTYNVYEIVYDPKTFAVGTAFFVQVLAAGDIDWTAAEATLSRPLYAPQREAKDVDEFRLSLRSESNDAVNDVLFFSASEEAIETYMIGHDLLKKGTPTEAKKAQMWAIKDGKNLCDVEATLVNDEATTPLNLYAPNAGQYILAVEEMPEDATLYLTYNGNVIWDLTASPYVLDLTKGTTTGYGLRIEAANAPQITTGVEDVQGDGTSVRKVIIDNTMYIITPEGEIYNAIGKKVQ